MGTRNGLHRSRHPEPVEGCWGCKALTVQFGSAQGSAMRRRDLTFAADQDAYKRLRADGLQPHSPEGAAQVEQHQLDQIEIDYRRPLPNALKSQLQEVQTAEALAQYGVGSSNA